VREKVHRRRGRKEWEREEKEKETVPNFALSLFSVLALSHRVWRVAGKKEN